MRTIKFRAWSLGKKDNGIMSFFTLEEMASDMGYVNIENVMQFTGLLDNNGKEIYENDKVEGLFYNDDEKYVKVKGKVVFSYGVFELQWDNGSHYPLYKISEKEVVGDPELLNN